MGDGKDIVVELDMEPSSSGAPCPLIVSNEHNLYVAYYLQDIPENYKFEAIGLVKFKNFHAYQFGPPNDEAFHGHPLYKKGLKPYGTYEILKSSWVARFEMMNSVHEYHSKESFDNLHHYVWSFHDTTLEVVAKGYSLNIKDDTINSVVSNIVSNIE
ncbi:MAG: hypothetical protein ACC707_15340 [Thiohalomonadales bacterium]